MKQLVQEILGGFLKGVFTFINPKYEKKILNEIRNCPGIYCIENIITGDKYVGQSKHISLRLQEHLTCLKNNHHYYKKRNIPTILQKAWNKYGEQNFRIYILTYCKKEELNEKEIYWIKKLKTNRGIYGTGYNLTDGGAGTSHKSPNKGRKQMNNGIIQKMVKIEDIEYYKSLGFKMGILEGTKEKVNKNRNAVKGINHHWHKGNKPLEEELRRREGIQKYWDKYKETPEYKKRIENKRIQNEIKKKALEEKRESYKVIQCDANNNIIYEYNSPTEAARQNNIPSATMFRWLRNPKIQRDNTIWRYKYDTQI